MRHNQWSRRRLLGLDSRRSIRTMALNIETANHKMLPTCLTRTQGRHFTSTSMTLMLALRTRLKVVLGLRAARLKKGSKTLSRKRFENWHRNLCVLNIFHAKKGFLNLSSKKRFAVIAFERILKFYMQICAFCGFLVAKKSFKPIRAYS